MSAEEVTGYRAEMLEGPHGRRDEAASGSGWRVRAVGWWVGGVGWGEVASAVVAAWAVSPAFVGLEVVVVLAFRSGVLDRALPALRVGDDVVDFEVAGVAAAAHFA